MKLLHRRRLALGTVILLALMGFLIFLWKMGSQRQEAEVLAEESASLRTGQPLLGRVSEPGARSESDAVPLSTPRPPVQSDPWLKEDPKVRLLSGTIDEVVTENSFAHLSLVAEGVVLEVRIRPTWVADGQVQLACGTLRVSTKEDDPFLVDLASGKNGLPNPGLPNTGSSGVDNETTLRGVMLLEAHLRGDKAAIEALSDPGKSDIWFTPRLVTSPGREATLESSETVAGSVLGIRAAVTAERVGDGTALHGQVIVRYPSKQLEDTVH